MIMIIKMITNNKNNDNIDDSGVREEDSPFGRYVDSNFIESYSYTPFAKTPSISFL